MGGKTMKPETVVPGPVAARVLEAVAAYDFRWRGEKDLQDNLVLVFQEAGIVFEREKSFLAKETVRRSFQRADGSTTTLTRLDTQVLPERLVPRPEPRVYQILAEDLGLQVDEEGRKKGTVVLKNPPKGPRLAADGQTVTSDRPDFFIPGGVVVEVKIDGEAGAVMRQLFRYGQLPEVTEIVLVTGCAIHQAMPPRLANKPVHVAYVGGTFGGFR